MKTGWKKWFRKRYIALFIPLIMFVSAQSGCLSFRMSDARQEAHLRKAGQRQPTFHTFQKNGHTIHYTQISENDSLPVLLLLHGSPGSSSAFIDYLADRRLSRVARLIAVDRPGNGYADYGKSVPSLSMQSALLKPIVEKHLPRPVIVLGHSLGGPVAARMAMDYPELLHSIILVAPSIDPGLEPKEGWFRRPMDWFFIRWLLPPSIVVSNQEILSLKKELEEMLPLWEKINLPVTVIQGEKDGFVPKENADFAKKMLKNSPSVDTIIVSGGSHFIVWTQYERMIREILMRLPGK